MFLLSKSKIFSIFYIYLKTTYLIIYYKFLYLLIFIKIAKILK